MFRFSASNLTLFVEREAKGDNSFLSLRRLRDDRELDESNDRVGFLLLGQEKT